MDEGGGEMTTIAINEENLSLEVKKSFSLINTKKNFL